jgi:hypothetical protein
MILVHTHSSSTDRLYYTPIERHSPKTCSSNLLRKRLAMSYKKTKVHPRRGALQDIHLPHLALPPRFSFDTSDRIAYPPALGAHLLVEGLKSITAIDSAAWQYHRIILDYALGMMCVRDVAR